MQQDFTADEMQNNGNDGQDGSELQQNQQSDDIGPCDKFLQPNDIGTDDGQWRTWPNEDVEYEKFEEDTTEIREEVLTNY